ncbi:hypothetical protein GCM10022419_031980 [Nonomuraea rosea]|uniref:Alpha/beta hydrolase n=1 Tax=Nonomuraea rosea TaxID=638574 RepID=A0ABP6WDZ6_9ACTN
MYGLLDQAAGRLRRWRRWCGRPEPELLRLLGHEDAGGRTFADLLGPRHPYLVDLAYSLHRHDPGFLDALLDHRESVFGDVRHAGAWLDAVPGPVPLLRGDPAVEALTAADDVSLVRAHGGEIRTVAGVGHGLHHAAPAEVAEHLFAFIRAATP